MVMVSLSNYYYEHQDEYLAALYESPKQRTQSHAFPEICLAGSHREVRYTCYRDRYSQQEDPL